MYLVVDVVQTLEGQREEIIQLRSRMLSEYDQLLAVRTDAMAAQAEEVDRLQREMEEMQHKYEGEMKTFQAKVEAQSGVYVTDRPSQVCMLLIGPVRCVCY